MAPSQDAHIKLAGMTITQNEINDLCQWLSTNPKLTKGELTLDLEDKFSKYIGITYSLFVNSGSSANLLLAATNLHYKSLRNKKVIVPAVSWSTTLAPFMQLGYEPILVDCDPKTLGVDITHLKSIISEHDPATMILVHVLGHESSIEQISELCSHNDIRLFEDTCEALGSEIDNKKLGSYGLASSFSFYFGHHISTVEGGMISSNDNTFIQIATSIRSHGWNRDLSADFATNLQQTYDIADFRNLYTFYYPGFNLRSTEISAFLGLSQLNKIQDVCTRRSYIFDLYSQLLPSFWLQSSNCSLISSFAFGTLIENPEETSAFLKENSIESRPLICGSLGLQPYWRNYNGTVTHLPVADLVHNKGIYLPIHCDLTDEDVCLVADKFKSIAIPLQSLNL